MPLDDLQKAVLAILLSGRTPQSVFAGGSVLNRHTYRLSGDQDIFHAENIDVRDVAKNDIVALRAAGFAVDDSMKYDGFIEVVVGDEARGLTKIQWVEAGSWAFFTPVPDPEYGFRLHIADIAINKALAAGGRREVRDFVDLALIHKHIMPLWQAIWAAPGKDENWSPLSLAEQIARKNNFRQDDIDEEIDSLIEISAIEIGSVIREAIDEAREVFETLPFEMAGTLFVDSNGHLIDRSVNIDALLSTAQTLEPRRGGAWPSGPDIDHALIDGLIERFGRDGTKLLESDNAADVQT